MSSTILSQAPFSLSNIIKGALIDEFKDLYAEHLKKTHNFEKPDSHYSHVKKLTLSDEQLGFTEEERTELNRIWSVFVEVRKIEYSLCDQIQKSFCDLLEFGITKIYPIQGISNIEDDKVSSLARSYFNALLNETHAKWTKKKIDPRTTVDNAKAIVFKEYMPKLTKALKQANQGSAVWLQSLDALADFMKSDLGKKLSALEIQWHHNVS